MTESPLTPRYKEEIKRNIEEIRENIARAAAQAGRSQEEVQLMAVTKTVHPDAVNCAWENGIDLFGENRVQEYASKASFYRFGPEKIHFIGTLQSNKAGQLIGRVSCVESVNSLKLAAELNKRAAELAAPLDILLEINIGSEANKTGLNPTEMNAFLDNMGRFKNLCLRDLMCIPPFDASEYETERYFDQMAKLFVDIKDKKSDNINVNILSMGMTGDYALAVRHGSTLVRIGTGIFGRRN